MKDKLMFDELEMFYDTSANDRPSVESLIRFFKYCKEMGYTGIILGFSTNIEIPGEPYFGYQQGRYTKDELKAIGKACKDLGLNLTPHFQNLGHVYHIGKYATYFDYCDDKEVLLEGDPRTLKLVEKIFAVLKECFDTDRIHIGMDEAFQMGRGKHLDLFGYEPMFNIISRHLEEIRKLCFKYGFTKIEMWSDMYLYNIFPKGFLDKPKEEVRAFVEGKIPSDVTLSHWTYIKDNADGFRDELEKHLKITDNISYTGAAINWVGYAPDSAHAFRVLSNNLKISKELGAKKINIANWVGTGFSGGMYTGLPVFYFAAEMAYGRATCIDDIDKARFKRLFGAEFDDFMMLDLLNKPHPDHYYDWPSAKSTFYAFQDVLIGQMDAFLSENTGKDYQKVYEKLSAVKAGDFQYLFDLMSALAKVLVNKSELGKNLKNAYDKGDKNELTKLANEIIPVVIEDVKKLFECAMKIFTNEFVENAYEVVQNRYGGLLKRLERVRARINDYLNGKNEKIDELEDQRIATYIFSGNKNMTEDSCLLYGWNALISLGKACNN